MFEGLLTALHLKLVHPSCHQYELKKVISRYFYALDLAGCVERVLQACHQCLALSNVPASLSESTTSDPPVTIGRSFAADVMKRQKQVILVLREAVTSYTRACILIDEKMETLRNGLLLLCMDLQPLYVVHLPLSALMQLLDSVLWPMMMVCVRKTYPLR